MALVEVRNLTVTYAAAPAPAVRDVSFTLEKGSFVSIVGGSGSGKSTLAMAIGRLTDTLNCRVTGGIRFNGRPVLEMGREELRRLRRTEIGYVFQEPAASLDPVFRVGDQIRESLRPDPAHEGRAGRAGRSDDADVVRLLRAAQVRDPERVARAYPHELSGGLKQRAMIAMALAKEPELLIADEPTTALDATVQKEILRLLLDLGAARGLAVLFITHDLRVAAAVSKRILVLREGEIAEEILLPTRAEPSDPYARTLLRCATAPPPRKAYFDVT